MKTILIIEDENDLAELVAFNLEKEGYRPLIAHDGPSGLEAARHNLPDLILLDIMLPGMDGLEVLKALKAEPARKRLPVIMTTAKGEEADVVVGFGGVDLALAVDGGCDGDAVEDGAGGGGGCVGEFCVFEVDGEECGVAWHEDCG